MTSVEKSIVDIENNTSLQLENLLKSGVHEFCEDGYQKFGKTCLPVDGVADQKLLEFMTSVEKSIVDLENNTSLPQGVFLKSGVHVFCEDGYQKFGKTCLPLEVADDMWVIE